MDVLALWILLASVLWLDLEGVGTEVISLSLEKVGWEILGTVTVEPRERSAEAWSWDTDLGGLSDDLSPSWLGLVDGVLEEVVEEQVLELWVGAVGIGDVLEEDGADDAASAPHESDGWLVQLPAVLLGCLLHKHESLSVRDDLGGVKSLLEILKKLLLVAGEGLLAGLQLEDGGGLGALALDGGEAASEDGLGDQSDWHTEIKSVDGGPLSGTLLASGVEDLLKERSSIVIVEVHDVAGNLNQEGIKNALVPLSEDITDLLSAHSKHALHDIVSLMMLAPIRSQSQG